MLPWGHAALGYLLYSAYTRWRVGRPPIGLAVYAVGLGTQFPDVVDKPLAWSFAVLPSGRSLGHSLLTLAVLLVVLRMAFQYPDQRTLSTAFGMGYVSHLFGDAINAVGNGEFGELAYLLWPLTKVPAGESRSFIEFFLAIEPTAQLLAGVVLTVFGVAVWIYDGLPGVKDLFGAYQRAAEETDPHLRE